MPRNALLLAGVVSIAASGAMLAWAAEVPFLTRDGLVRAHFEGHGRQQRERATFTWIESTMQPTNSSECAQSPIVFTAGATWSQELAARNGG
jgi:hypothetical protein